MPTSDTHLQMWHFQQMPAACLIDDSLQMMDAMHKRIEELESKFGKS